LTIFLGLDDGFLGSSNCRRTNTLGFGGVIILLVVVDLDFFGDGDGDGVPLPLLKVFGIIIKYIKIKY
jgi:hypothetical protein